MPKTDLDGEIQDLESSTESDLDVTSEATEANAESSSATGETEPDMLSVVRDVVGEKSESDAGAASPAEGQESGEPADVPEAQEHAESDDENFSDVPFSKHPRFKQLVRQRNELRADATRYRNVQAFMDQHGLTAEEGAEAFLISGLLKTNPVAAWARLKPIVQGLLTVVGEVLPDDLAQRVQTGEMTHDVALEVSRARARAQSQERYVAAEQQRMQRAREMEANAAIESAAGSWESDRRLKDPHFEAKLPLLKDAVAGLIMQEGRPTTPEGVRSQLQRAYEVTNSRFAAPRAPQPARKPAVRPISSANVAGNAQAAPDSTLDIIKAVRDRRG